jgi:putative Mg2+ transporter-C (MgtC) family protein
MDILHAYWSPEEIATNGLILLHLLGALAVGIVLGYERSFHGRAAGMRTYVLVCLTSTLLVAINAYPDQWYGGLIAAPSTGDPTRVIQGILTGMGFLGAGVIIRDGLTIRGLSTAASLWLTAGIGVLIGVGFYAAAMAATLIGVSVMSGFRWVEKILPHQTMIRLFIAYPHDQPASRDSITTLASTHGYEVIDWTFRMDTERRRYTYDLILLSQGADRSAALADDLQKDEILVEYAVSPARN